MDCLELLAVQRTVKSLLQHHSSKASILWCSAFFIFQLSHPYPDQEGRKGSEEGVPENLSVPLEGDRDFGELCVEDSEKTQRVGVALPSGPWDGTLEANKAIPRV